MCLRTRDHDAGTGQDKEHVLVFCMPQGKISCPHKGKPEMLNSVTVYTGRAHRVLIFLLPLDKLGGLLLLGQWCI